MFTFFLNVGSLKEDIEPFSERILYVIRRLEFLVTSTCAIGISLRSL